MRFNLKFELKKKEIPLDYRRAFISFLKSSFEDYSEKFYEKNYIGKMGRDPIVKPFTFSVYMKNPKFLSDKIEIEGNEIYLNYSTFSQEYGLYFYNSILGKLHKVYNFKNSFEFTLINVKMAKEKVIKSNEAIFKTLSPVVIRYHDNKNRDNSKDNHLVYNDENFLDQMKINIYESGKSFFDFDIKKDVENLKIEIGKMKSVPISHFEERIHRRITGNIGIVKISGDGYLLDYLYKAGIGSRRSQGFGMVDMV
ncbi:CRISPR-associated endoribonuclease Cas6 [Haliovirga abyssi]|uniref:CRISPR-associated endoribonuclease Cas6 n=1 Tax=Haliovirga abyssi TaxID=2996794 RepID=A0AAU9DEV7_9FUSO|nr:CRISPR-associated endoribonuclease Cas6 [Haliovirga abyssi]BDU50912.1 CRISPR-associated endoribonuclease Cas6 [Haliovirga abyssi]